MWNSQKSKTISAAAAAAVLAGSLVIAPAAAQAQGLSGVTSCGASGGKQETGALVGALLGGVIGNKVGGRHATAETALGAVAGAAAGSAVGCQMQHNDAKNAYGRGATYTRNGYRLSSDIAPASYSRMNEGFVASRTVNLRAAPTTGSARVGSLRSGERFQALASVRGSDWILVGQGGVGVGYVHAAYVQPANARYARY